MARVRRETAYCPQCGYPMMPLPLYQAKFRPFMCAYDGLISLIGTRQQTYTLSLPAFFELSARLLIQPIQKAEAMSDAG